MQEELKFDSEWNQLITDHIGWRLSLINAPIDLLFGIFTYGKKQVDKEIFKQILLV
jgi:hypothetical protein